MVMHRRSAMFDIAKITARQPLPAGERVQVIANSATLAAQLTPTIDAVGLLSERAGPSAPGPVAAGGVRQAAQEALADPDCDSVLCAAVNVYSEGVDDVISALDGVAPHTTKPLIGVFLDFHDPLTAMGPDVSGSLPRFDSGPTRSGRWPPSPRTPAGGPATPAPCRCWSWTETGPAASSTRCCATSRRVASSRWPRSTELLAAYGIPVLPRYSVSSLDEACRVAEDLGWDVVLKATAQRVRGRPDLASVHRDIDDPEEMAQAWDRPLRAARRARARGRRRRWAPPPRSSSRWRRPASPWS